MIGAKEEAIYWQGQSANEYRLARREHDLGHKRKAVMYQISAAWYHKRVVLEMKRMELP